MNKTYSYIVSGIILFLLVLPTLFSFIVNSNEDSASDENREMAEFPQFDIKNLDKFPKAFSDYYNDHFSLRPASVKFYNRFNYFFLKKSPDETKAILGKDNWIFLGKDIDYYRGLVRLDDVESLKMKAEFERRKSFLDDHNCKFLIVIIPGKKEIYPEYLPIEYFKYSKTTMTDQFTSIIYQIPGIDLIDLRPVLTRAKSRFPELYHRYDHHWNDFGAFPAYEHIIDYVNQYWNTGEKRSVDDFEPEKYMTQGGSLAKMLGVEDKISFYRYRMNPKFTYDQTKLPRKYEAPAGFAYPFAFENRFENANNTLPRLMMINDSFGEYLFKNLSEHFSYSIFLFDAWQYKLNADILIQEKPDLYILCIYESFIPNILDHLGE